MTSNQRPGVVFGWMVADLLPNWLQPGVQRLYAHVFQGLFLKTWDSTWDLSLNLLFAGELWWTHFIRVSPSWKHTQIGIGSTELRLPWRTVRKALMRPAWLAGDGSGFRMKQSDWRLFKGFRYKRIQKKHVDYSETSTWDSRWINDVSPRVLQDEPFISILSL